LPPAAVDLLEGLEKLTGASKKRVALEWPVTPTIKS